MPRGDAAAMVVLVRAGVEVVAWPVGERARADLSMVDEVARLALAARRLGCSIRLRGPSLALWELLELVGLGDIVDVDVAGVGLGEVGGEVEGGE